MEKYYRKAWFKQILWILILESDPDCAYYIPKNLGFSEFVIFFCCAQVNSVIGVDDIEDIIDNAKDCIEYVRLVILQELYRILVFKFSFYCFKLYY